MSKALAQGDLRKSLQMQGLTGIMALHGIAALALDQRAWRDRAVAFTAAAAAGNKGSSVVAGMGGEGKSGVSVASEAAMAVNVLRGVVRACGVDTLQLLLQAGGERGLGGEEQRRALAQAAHGDAELMEKVRRLLG
jgi:hypothetical protein